jgi:hypothetical protein
MLLWCTVHQYTGAASCSIALVLQKKIRKIFIMGPYWWCKRLVILDHLFAPILLVQQERLHQYIGARCIAAPIYWWNFASCTLRRRKVSVQYLEDFFNFFKRFGGRMPLFCIYFFFIQ